MSSNKQLSILKKTREMMLLGDPLWRMDNLYWIKDSQGNRIKFKMNWAQKILWEDPHPCKIVLKARQLGITTYSCLRSLDRVLWGHNHHAGIIAHTQDDASSIFKDKLRFAFEQIHPVLRTLFTTIGDSARELSFSHGSTIRVGTSLRSSTLQNLHISEFGKICAKYPEKAREVISGALNTLAVGQECIIESTAEGKDGYFYDMCQEAFENERKGKLLTPLDFKAFFFPWWKEPSYSMGVPVELTKDLEAYFDKLELDGIKLSMPQKWWYAKKAKIQREDMFREFPSKPEEAFQASQEGYWYAREMKELHDNGHITNVSYDKALPVHSSWDLGQADSTSIWFFQINRSDDVNVIDFWQKTNTPLAQIAQMLKDKGYTYGTHLWPHDANARDRAGITFVQQARNFNLTGTITEQHGLLEGINLVRTGLGKCWFDRTKCMEGIRHLENYAKKWNNSFGGWSSEPLHNEASHAADSFRYLIAGLSRITGASGSLEKDYSHLRKFWGS